MTGNAPALLIVEVDEILADLRASDAYFYELLGEGLGAPWSAAECAAAAELPQELAVARLSGVLTGRQVSEFEGALRRSDYPDDRIRLHTGELGALVAIGRRHEVEIRSYRSQPRLSFYLDQPGAGDVGWGAFGVFGEQHRANLDDWLAVPGMNRVDKADIALVTARPDVPEWLFGQGVRVVGFGPGGATGHPERVTSLAELEELLYA